MSALSTACSLMVLVVLGATGCSKSSPETGPETAPVAVASEWPEDIKWLRTALRKRHPNIHAKVSEKELSARFDSLARDAAKLSELEIGLRLMQIFAKIGDGHTQVRPQLKGTRALPLQLRGFKDGIFVVATAPDARDLLGAKLTRVGETPIAVAIAKLTPYIVHENQPTLRMKVAGFLTSASVLKSAGLIQDTGRVSLTFTVQGKARSMTMDTVAAEALRSVAWVRPSRKLALYEKQGARAYWNDWLPKAKTLYFKYNRCAGREGFAKLVAVG